MSPLWIYIIAEQIAKKLVNNDNDKQNETDSTIKEQYTINTWRKVAILPVQWCFIMMSPEISPIEIAPEICMDSRATIKVV